jgi:Mrp family chromosome partitioning ATPase
MKMHGRGAAQTGGGQDAARPYMSEAEDVRLPVAVPPWRARKLAGDAPALTVDGVLMRDLAARAMQAGGAGMTKVGVASVRHGEGATTIARSLAACLAAQFGQRVVLVEANHRSPRLREVCGLPPGAGFLDVLSGAASVEAALRMSRTAGKMLVLPASVAAGAGADGGAVTVAALQGLVAELFFYADALVFDLAPLLPYPDSVAIGRALDGVALVMRAGQASRTESAQAVAGLQGAGVKVLGAVLNREKRGISGVFGRRA